MKTATNSGLILYGLIVLLCVVTGCREQTTEPKQAVNFFSMSVNGQTWKPSQSAQDPCFGTFWMQYGSAGGTPRYLFLAYYDSLGRADFRSQDVLIMQVMGITKPGTYSLTGTWKSNFESYTIFRRQLPNGQSRRYVNDPARGSFTVTVSEWYIRPSSVIIPSLRGTFSGTLYAEENPSDSVVIRRGGMAFIRPTSSTDQCDY